MSNCTFGFLISEFFVVACNGEKLLIFLQIPNVSGAQGAVYKAFWKTKQQIVAVKHVFEFDPEVNSCFFVSFSLDIF